MVQWLRLHASSIAGGTDLIPGLGGIGKLWSAGLQRVRNNCMTEHHCNTIFVLNIKKT